MMLRKKHKINTRKTNIKNKKKERTVRGEKRKNRKIKKLFFNSNV
jgi:hypothetical protein